MLLLLRAADNDDYLTLFRQFDGSQLTLSLVG